MGKHHTPHTAKSMLGKRPANIGVLTKELALSYGCTGPMLRGSLDRSQGDPDWDLRKIEPYCGYEGYDFKAVVPPFTDDYYDDQEYGIRPRTPHGPVIGDAWPRF